MHRAPSAVSAGELPFGLLGRPHGTSGELILRPYHPGGLEIDRLPVPLTVTLGQPGEPIDVVIGSVRRGPDGFLVRFDGVASREDAARLTGRELRICKAVLPPLADGEFYVEDLVGCVVQDEQGRILGTVSGVFWNGAHDVISIEGDDRLIPVVPEFIVSVDPAKRIVAVDLHE